MKRRGTVRREELVTGSPGSVRIGRERGRQGRVGACVVPVPVCFRVLDRDYVRVYVFLTEYVAREYGEPDGQSFVSFAAVVMGVAEMPHGVPR